MEVARAVFMGSESIALPMLEDLVCGQSGKVLLTGVFTGADKPSGRGLKLKPNPIKIWAQEQGIAIRQPERIDPSDVEWLKNVGCDLLLVMSYGHILKQDVLDLPPLGALNLHTSLLPAYRGPAPIEAAIANGEKESGVTLMEMVPKVDAGSILDCEKVPICSWDTSADLREKLGLACVPLIRRCLPAILKGEAVSQEQDSARASFTRLLGKSDGCLDFGKSAVELTDRIRALLPWPGCYFEHQGMRIKVGRADVVEGIIGGKPGEVLEAGGKTLAVSTGKSVLRFLALQRPGGKMLPVDDFLRGFPIPAKTVLSGGEMSALSSSKPFPKRKK